ncbi:MAG: hypothetical protein EPN88_12780, partial [Bacteroidetes bacterium]
MKTLIIFSIFILNIQNIFGFRGELRFFIDDDNSLIYKIIATRYSLTEPLFGINYMVIESDLYNTVVSDQIITGGLPPNYDLYLGFDYLRDQGNYYWPFIGEGKYIFSIYKDNVLVFRFVIDLLHIFSSISSPDIDFYYTANTGIMIAEGNGEPTIIEFDAFVNCWTLHNQVRNIDYYENDVELTNGGDYGLNNEIKNIYGNSLYGFPYDNYPSGTEFTAGVHENFWRGAKYDLSVNSTSYIQNNINYKFRNWENYNIFTSPGTLKIKDETNAIRSMFHQTYSVTVYNNLEGGNGGTYKVTWDKKPNDPETIISNQFYYSFKYNLIRQDKYTFEVSNNFPALNTTWYFKNWDDGSTSNIKSNIEITQPTTFIANYKGSMRSNNANAFANNGQRKLVRTTTITGVHLHCVYESMGKVWYERSTDGGLTWNLMNNGQPVSQNNSKLPSIDYYNTVVVIVFQEDNGGLYKIKSQYYAYTDNVFSRVWEEAVFESNRPYSEDANPVVSYGSLGKALISWETKGADGGFNAGLIVSLHTYSYYPNTNILHDRKNVTATDANSFSPSVAFTDYNANSFSIHLVWEQRINDFTSKIKYSKIIANGNNTLTIPSAIELSSGSGFTRNKKPSLIEVGIDGIEARICW